MAFVIKTRGGRFAKKRSLVDDVNAAQIWATPGKASQHASTTARFRPNCELGRELDGAVIVEIVMTTSAPVEQLAMRKNSTGTMLIDRTDLRVKPAKKPRKGAKEIAPADFFSTLDKALAKLEK